MAEWRPERARIRTLPIQFRHQSDSKRSRCVDGRYRRIAGADGAAFVVAQLASGPDSHPSSFAITTLETRFRLRRLPEASLFELPLNSIEMFYEQIIDVDQSDDQPGDCPGAKVASRDSAESGPGISSLRRFVSGRAFPKEPSSATRTSWLRVRTSDLANSCCTKFFTELSESPMSSAISLFDRPPMMPESTFRWRSSSGLAVV